MCTVRCVTETEQRVIAINFDAENARQFTLDLSCKLAGTLLTGDEEATLDTGAPGTALNLPPYSIAIMLPFE